MAKVVSCANHRRDYWQNVHCAARRDFVCTIRHVQDRLSSVITNGVTTTFLYDYAGIRVRTVSGSTTNRFLIDPNNPTGYAQVLEQRVNGSLVMSYILGDDVIGQVSSGGTVSYLLYDGHGSTRQLSQPANTVVEQYNYDAFGVGLSLTNAPATTLLYAGEQYDTTLKQY
jgi:hypothetical protein